MANVVSPQEGEGASETLGAFWKPAWGVESEYGGRHGDHLMEKLAQGGEEREVEAEMVGWELLRIDTGRGKRASREGEIRGRRRRGVRPTRRQARDSWP